MAFSVRGPFRYLQGPHCQHTSDWEDPSDQLCGIKSWGPEGSPLGADREDLGMVTEGRHKGDPSDQTAGTIALVHRADGGPFRSSLAE